MKDGSFIIENGTRKAAEEARGVVAAPAEGVGADPALVPATEILKGDPFDGRQAAEESVRATHGRGGSAYVVIVPFREVPAQPDNKTVAKNVELASKYAAEAVAFATANHAVNRTSQYIGCRACNSKLNRERLADRLNAALAGYIAVNGKDGDGYLRLVLRRLDACPVCGADLRSESTMKRIEGYETRIDKADKAIEEGRARIRRVAYNKTPTQWLVVYHIA